MYYSRLQNLFNSIRSILSENFFFLCSFIKDFCKVLTSFHRETWPGDCSQCGHPDLNYMFFFTLYFFLGFQEEMRLCSLQNHLSLNTLNKKKRKTRSTALARMYPALWKILQIGRSHRMETMSLWVAGAETLMSSERGLQATHPSSPADSAWECSFPSNAEPPVTVLGSSSRAKGSLAWDNSFTDIWEGPGSLTNAVFSFKNSLFTCYFLFCRGWND